jgi:transposase
MRPVPLELSAKDRQRLIEMQSGGVQMTARKWRRIRTLVLLGDGLSARETAKAVGCYPREARRIGHRYREKGLEGALGDEQRPKPEPLLDSTQQAAVVAMVCGPPPEGRARWTVRLVAAEAVQRGITSRLGRETARVVLACHGLKPWREKNVVRAGHQRGVRRAHGGRAQALRAPP